MTTVKIECQGTTRPHKPLLITRLNCVVDEAGRRLIQDDVTLPEGNGGPGSRTEARARSLADIKRPPGTDWAGRGYRIRNHVIVFAGPAGRSDLVAETDSATWTFSCRLCRPATVQFSNERLFRAAFNAVADNRKRISLFELDRYGDDAH